MQYLTILMTTYNEEKNIFLKSLESIQNQSFEQFEVLIIVDNKENKDIIEILERKSKEDQRIKYIINEENLGLPLSLNKGIDLIDTKYIARMDADDIAEFDRIEKQYKYLEEHPNVDLIGSNIIFMSYDESNSYKRRKIPTMSAAISQMMKYANVMSHPTFFGKTDVFKKIKYRNIKYSQDYDFCCRLIELKYNIGNINEYLLKYRLPKEENEKKIVFQNITYYYIQRNFRKKCLVKSDICSIINDSFSKVNVSRSYRAIKFYDIALDYLKNKKIISSLLYFFKSFALSKYQRQQIINLAFYYIKKRRYIKNEF